MQQKLLIKAFYNGYRKALKEFAYWKDGVEYIGCGVVTLKEELKNIDKEEAYALANDVFIDL